MTFETGDHCDRPFFLLMALNPFYFVDVSLKLPAAENGISGTHYLVLEKQHGGELCVGKGVVKVTMWKTGADKALAQVLAV